MSGTAAEAPCVVITRPGRPDNPARSPDVPEDAYGLTLLSADEYWTVAAGTRDEVLAAARALMADLALAAAGLEAQET